MLSTVTALLESARRASARAVNVVMTATHWEIGRRIVPELDRQISTLFLRQLAETYRISQEPI